jgi:predicted lactoylglutathione lyase
MHHICVRALSRADVDAVHELVYELGAKIVRAPQTGKWWAPGHYTTLFEDPDGTVSK